MTPANDNQADLLARVSELAIAANSMAVMCETLLHTRRVTPLDGENLRFMMQETIKLFLAVELGCAPDNRS